MGVLLFLAIILPALFSLSLTLPFPRYTRFSGLISIFVTFASLSCIFSIFLNIHSGQSELFSIPWAPSLKVNLSFIVDGLSLFFGFLVTGVGTLVNIYAYYYRYERYRKTPYLDISVYTISMHN